MESFDLQHNQEQEVQGLEKALEAERAGGRSIYQIARFAQMLTLRGKDVALTPDEKREIADQLENARKDENRLLSVHQGYEIARWLMLAKVLEVSDRISVTEQDQEKMRQAAVHFKNEKNLLHLASLKKTVEFLGLEVDTSGLSEDEKVALENEFEKMK